MGFSVSKRRRRHNMLNETSLSTNSSEVETRSWSDLPSELLQLIADRLGLIELLSFRGACKDWRSASSTASAQIESTSNQLPWLLLYEGTDSLCLLYRHSGKMYAIDIPEMKEATCIASNQGWLLLFQGGSIFFFCPFSRSKIDLPQYPHSELSNHVAAFSSPPTSQECIVSVINRCNEFTLELNVLRRGAKAWTKHIYFSPYEQINTITCATYHNGTFYYLDSKIGAVTFSVNDKRWLCYRIKDVIGTKEPTKQYLPFSYTRSYFRAADMKKRLGLGENLSVSTCGTLVPYDDYDLFMSNECIMAPKESESGRHLKVIWIQPRFLQIPPNQSWSL